MSLSAPIPSLLYINCYPHPPQYLMSPNLISVGVFAYPLWDLSYLGCEKYTVNNIFFSFFFLNLKLTTVDENLIRKGEKKKKQ